MAELNGSPVGDAIGAIPVPPRPTVEDERHARLALAVHAAEETPEGRRCRLDQRPYPCLLHRWACAVLRRRGLSDARLALLIERAGASSDRTTGVPPSEDEPGPPG